MREEEIYELFTNHKFKPQTPNSISGIIEMMKHIEKTRAQGYSTHNEEYSLGLRFIAAPIFDHTGKVIAGLSIAAPLVRFAPV